MKRKENNFIKAKIDKSWVIDNIKDFFNDLNLENYSLKHTNFKDFDFKTDEEDEKITKFGNYEQSYNQTSTVQEPTYRYSDNRKNFNENLYRKNSNRSKLREKQKYITSNNKESNLTKINSEKNNNVFKFSPNKKDFEPLVRKKQAKLIEIENKNREKMQNRADVIYGDDETYFKKYKKSKKYNYFQMPKQNNKEKNSHMAIENIAEKLIETKKPLLHNDKIDNLELVNSINVELDNGESIPITDFVPNLKENLDTALKYPLSIDANLLIKVFPKFCDYIYKKYGRNVEAKNIVKLKEWAIVINNIFDEKIRLYKNITPLRYAIKLFLDFTENTQTEELKDMLEMFLDSSNLTSEITKLAGLKDADLLKLTAENANLNTKYTKNADIYNSPNELPEKLQPIIKNKLTEQKLSLNSKGIIFNFDSEIAQRVTQNSDFKKFIKNNIDKIPSCYENKDFNSSMQFTDKDFNMYLIFRNVDVIDLKRDIFGNITGYILDTTDYNENDSMNLVKAARRLQEQGKIEPLFVLVKFYVRTNNNER